jgi:crotonobetainyl-CoA:carnitine CoA-transferase CaiB-like acyl-CoA transferase
LRGVRIADLTWLLASAATSTLLASLGAQVIRIEWPGRLDFTRLGETAGVGVIGKESNVPPLAPGKRAVPYRDPPQGPKAPPYANRAGVFNDRNPGKLGITLNMNHPEGRALFRRLLAVSDVAMDGFTAPMMGRWGLDYEGMKKVKEDIIYIQMSGFGNSGPYRDYGSVGPIAQASAGLAWQGLPEPQQPTSWNHSYMDTTPPLYSALAVIGALYYKRRTGKGQYIDQAQYAPGLLLGGTSVIDFSANGRRTERHGNRSPYLAAAPHGIYRCAGDDAWIAIAVFSDPEWSALRHCMGNPAWAAEAKYATADSRVKDQDELDRRMEDWTKREERYDLMYRLQATGVRAGVVQSPRDKFETDPQLKVRDFFVHLDHSELGVRPFTRHFTPKLSATPAHPGGTTQRGAPCIGEDNDTVYRQILGLSSSEIDDYIAKGVI